MDADSELQLYEHVEFLAANISPRQEIAEFSKSKPLNKEKNGKKSQPMKKYANNVSNVEFQLTSNELLFIPKQYDPTPLRHRTTKVANDFIQKRTYLQKLRGKGPNEQRQFRAKQDARYLHHKAKKPNQLSLLKTNDNRMLCLDHLNGRCKSDSCGKYHQLRNQRLFGVCRFYLSGSCRDSHSCPFMHEEFPCRYYYLNMPHPKTIKIDECRFKHGGPLSRQLGRYFKKQLEEWVKKLTITTPQQFDSMLMSYIDKFDEKQNQLEHEYDVKDSGVALTSTSNESSFEHILSVDQIKALAKRNITNAAQLNCVPVDELLDYGLTMDQIYKITIDTCNQSNSMPIKDDDVALDSVANNELNLNPSSNSTDTMDADSSFEGFCDNDWNDAEDQLQSKKVMADEEETVRLLNRIDSNDHQCNQEQIENVVEGEDDADSSNDSKDSDDELSLLIDENI